MLRWAGFLGCMAVVAVSGCKKTTHITVVQPEPDPISKILSPALGSKSSIINATTNGWEIVWL